MKLSMKLAAAAAVGVLVGGLFVAGYASAAKGDCQVTVTTLVNHPDHGPSDPGNVWAVEKIIRTVTICEGDPITSDEAPLMRAAVPQIAVGWSHYKATVEDTGTFVTNAGAHLSPARGENLVGDVHGTLTGHFAVNFIAVDNFLNFKHVYGGNTYSGTDPSTTGDFVEGDWGSKDFYGTDAAGNPQVGQVKNGFDGESWSWTYKTCTEQWIDAYANNDGTDQPGAGDITGATACPKPSPSPSPSVSPTPSPTTTPAPTPVPVTNPITVTG